MELYYRAIERAVKSWKSIQDIPDYEELVGKLLFQQIFELIPQAISLYSFGSGVDERNIPEQLLASPTFKAHARNVVKMLESALTMMLKNELGNLALALQSLGARHVEYGVLPQHYGFVETALLRVLEGGLGPDKWTTRRRKAWAAVFKFIAKAMQSGATNEINIINEQSNEENQRKMATLRLTLLKPTSGRPEQHMISSASASCRWGEASSSASSPSIDNAPSSNLGGRRNSSSSYSSDSLPPSLPRRKWQTSVDESQKSSNSANPAESSSKMVNEGYIVVSANTKFNKDMPPSSTVTRRRHSSSDDSNRYWYWDEHPRRRGSISSDNAAAVVFKKDVSPSMNMPRRSVH